MWAAGASAGGITLTAGLVMLAACGTNAGAGDLASGGGAGADASTGVGSAPDATTGGSDVDGGAIEDASTLPPYDAANAVMRTVAVGLGDSLVLRPGGQIEGWGCYAGGVPDDTVWADGGYIDPPSATPRALDDGGSWRSVGINCALRGVDQVWCWGGLGGSKAPPYDASAEGTFYQEVAWQAAPGPVDGHWVFVTDTDGSACGIRTDGTAACWGVNWDGELGTGGDAGYVANARTPQSIVSGAQWRTISISIDHACGIQVDGTLWCWGDDRLGQLGLTGAGMYTTPQQVTAATDWDAVAVGSGGTCASKGTFLYCWGGQELDAGAEIITLGAPLPYGAYQFASSPAGWSRLAVDFHVGVCAVDGAGALVCNQARQSGVPTFASETWQDVAVDTNHTCAVAADGGVRCWGDNYAFDLGTTDAGVDQGGIDDPQDPVNVQGL